MAKSASYAAVPGRTPSGYPAAVDHQHGETLVCEPLRDQVGIPGRHHPLGARPSVGIEQDGEGP